MITQDDFTEVMCSLPTLDDNEAIKRYTEQLGIDYDDLRDWALQASMADIRDILVPMMIGVETGITITDMGSRISVGYHMGVYVGWLLHAKHASDQEGEPIPGRPGWRTVNGREMYSADWL